MPRTNNPNLTGRPADQLVTGTELMPLTDGDGTSTMTPLGLALGDLGIIQRAVLITAASATISNDPSVYYECNSGSGQTLTIPAGLTNYTDGMAINILPLGAGAVSILAGVGVTILGATTLVSQGQYKPIQLIRTLAADTYLAVGLN